MAMNAGATKFSKGNYEVKLIHPVFDWEFGHEFPNPQANENH
jgi:hypothetical protein